MTNKNQQRKEYGFLKQKNNWNDFIFLFSVLKIHTLSEDDLISHQRFFSVFSRNFSSKRKIKKQIKESKGKFRFQEKKVQALWVLEKISTL